MDTNLHNLIHEIAEVRKWLERIEKIVDEMIKNDIKP